jgi:hypothetical protein
VFAGQSKIAVRIVTGKLFRDSSFGIGLRISDPVLLREMICANFKKKGGQLTSELAAFFCFSNYSEETWIELLDRHAFGEISWTVDVAAAEQGDVVGQKLQRH